MWKAGMPAVRSRSTALSGHSGNQVDFHDIYTEGITKITSEDFLLGAEKAGTVPLSCLPSTQENRDTYCAMVSPALAHREHPLYVVNTMCLPLFFVKGNMLGNSMFYGSRAGKLRHRQRGSRRHGGCSKASGQRSSPCSGIRRNLRLHPWSR